MKRQKVNLIFVLIALLAILVVCIPLAACDASTHTISFYNGDTLVDSRKVNDGSVVIPPPPPDAPAGCVFDFWCEKNSDAAFDFDTPIKDDLNLYAHFSIAEDPIKDGSAAHPYIITKWEELVELADNVESQDQAAFAQYASANYALGADIDMSSAVGFYGIGRSFEKPFKGHFDGRGHTVSNLTIVASLRAIDDVRCAVGLFGITHSANIENLNISNFNYTLNCYSNDVKPYAGGAAGIAVSTDFKNVQVDGKITTFCSASNPAKIGGLIGDWYSEVNDGEMVRLCCTENCFAEVEVALGRDITQTVLEDDTCVGGLIGNIGEGTGIHAVINCATAGKLNGGQYVGGIVGKVTGRCTTIVNCFSNTYVKASAQRASRVGGLVGEIGDFSVIMDSLSMGSVNGKGSNGADDESYCGGVVGFKYNDDYEEYFSQGAVILNAYYTGSLNNNLALSLPEDDTYKLVDNHDIQAFLTDKLAWDARSWDFSRLQSDSIVKPTALTAADIQNNYSIKLMCNGSVWRTYDNTTQDGYSLLSSYGYDFPSAVGNKRFFDWMHYDRVAMNVTNIRYNQYIPIVKDITLVAKMIDVTPVLGTYTCVVTANGESRNAGSLAIKSNGTYVRYYDSGAEAPAPYLFDGEHLILRSQDDYEDLYICEFNQDKKQLSYSLSGNYGNEEYVFTWKELPFSGEFYSDNGDVIIFNSENGFCMSTADLVNSNGFEDFVVGNYTVDPTNSNLATLSGGIIADSYDSMTFTRNQDGSITVNAVGKLGHSNLNNVVFRALETVEYYDESFVGQYECVFVTANRQDTYTLYLGNDGSAIYEHNAASIGYYHFFNNTILLELSGRISRLQYLSDEDILFGFVNRGTSDRARCVFPRSNNGFVKAFLIDGSTENILFVNDTDVYLVKEGKYIENFVFDGAEKLRTLKDGDSVVVTLDGENYMAENAANQYYSHHYIMTYYGNEADEYVLGDKRITLDGKGGVRDEAGQCGKYVLYDTLVFVMFYDNSVLGFDYKDAKLAQNVITPKQYDSLQGAWITEEINFQGYNQVLKLLIDGFGHATIMYKFPDETSSEYTYCWDGWGTYMVTATGAAVTVDKFIFDVTFYYNKQISYLHSHNDDINELTFFVDGYVGSKTVPIPPSNILGKKYTGTDSKLQPVILNLDRSLNGTFCGLPFNGIFDGDHTVYFYIDDVTYAFDYQALKLSYGDECIDITPGVITDVIPASFCGTWTGTLVSNDSTSTAVTIVIDNTGRLSYCEGAAVSVTYDANHMIITVTVRSGSDSLDLTLTWNGSDGTFFIKALFESGRFMSGTLTKSVG